jgi:hypothetical protein
LFERLQTTAVYGPAARAIIGRTLEELADRN